MVKMSIGALFDNAKAVLKVNGIENYRQEAFYIIEKVTGFTKHELSIKGNMPIELDCVKQVDALLDRRLSGEPLQYILGSWEFYGLNFNVGEGVLIPRQDTETLVQTAIELLKDKDHPIIADLCSGSGCIAISLEKNIPDSKIFAIELSDDAIPYLIKNISQNSSSVKLIRGDVCDKITLDNLPQLDMVVANPPYLNDEDMNNLQKEVTFEPRMALHAENNGLFFYKAITALWKNKLALGGILAFECGMNQHEAVSNILKDNDFENICFKEDLCGIIRVVYATKNSI